MHRRPLPDAGVADYLVIGCVGVCDCVISSNYNSKPLAAEVLIRNGQDQLIRERQTFEDMVRGEIVP